MSGLSGFWMVYLRKPLKKRAKFERFLSVCLKSPKNRSNLAPFLSGFWAIFLDKPLKTVQILRGFWAVFLDKTVQKPLKPLILKQDFERNSLKKTAQTAQILLQIR